MRVEVSTQIQFEEALRDGHVAVCVSGSFRLATKGSDQPSIVLSAAASLQLVAWGSSQPHVEAWESSQPHVVARGSSQPHVVARESSQPHVEARESSQPHVVARESSQPHVEAWESSQPHVVARGSSQPHVVARGSSQPHVEAWAYVQAVFRGKVIARLSEFVSAVIFGKTAKVEGGRQVYVDLATPKAWCDYYGVEISPDGIAVLYKALNDDYTSPYCFSYAPGSIPEAPDWDGGKEECGGGLHFSPSPGHALSFHTEAKRFCACPINISDISVHPDGLYPEKVKASRCCAPVWEVDIHGARI